MSANTEIKTKDEAEALFDLRKAVTDGASDERLLGFIRQYPFAQPVGAVVANEQAAEVIEWLIGEGYMDWRNDGADESGHEDGFNSNADEAATLRHYVGKARAALAAQTAAPSEIERLRTEQDGLRQALEDMLDPIGTMRRELPEGHQLNGVFAIQATEGSQWYQNRARAALATQPVKPADESPRNTCSCAHIGECDGSCAPYIAKPADVGGVVPCPFCGGAANYSDYNTFGCQTCHVWMAKGREQDWNRRATQPAKPIKSTCGACGAQEGERCRTLSDDKCDAGKHVAQLAKPADVCGVVGDFYVVHGDDAAVDLFAAAMKKKMAESRAKGRDGWYDPEQCPAERLQQMLLDHLSKGDPVDVGNFAMMLFNRDLPTTALAAQTAALTGNGDMLPWAYCPECGSTEIHYEEGDHKQCEACHQEWWTDVDYTEVVRKHLGEWKAAQTAAPGVNTQEPFGMYVERDDGTTEFQRTGKAFQGTAQGYKAWKLFAAPQPVDGAAGGKPTADLLAMPGFMRRRIDEAVQAAVFPKGMSVHDGKAHVYASDLIRMLAIIDAAPAPAAPVDLSGSPMAAMISAARQFTFDYYKIKKGTTYELPSAAYFWGAYKAMKALDPTAGAPVDLSDAQIEAVANMFNWHNARSCGVHISFGRALLAAARKP